MTDNNISPGDIVSGFDPSELVEVRKLGQFGNKTLVEAIGLESRREIKRPLTSGQLAQLVRIRSGGYSFDGDAETFLFGTEAERIRIAYQFDPLFAVNSSVIDVLVHQVDAVYRYLLPLPRIRFLLADDTGAACRLMRLRAKRERLPASRAREVMLDPNEEGLWIIPPFEEISGPAGEEAATAATDTAEGEKLSASATGAIEKKINNIRISGDVPVENWADIFRSFVSPAARMDLQELKLGIEFVLLAKTDKPLDPNYPTIKAFVESARHLGLDLKFNSDT